MISADSSTHSSLPRKEAGQPQTVFRKYAASIKNTLTIVSEARRGVAAETFFDVADASLLNQNLLADLLHISLKTFSVTARRTKGLTPPPVSTCSNYWPSSSKETKCSAPSILSTVG
jgi:hypothetical protein